jgi:ABC-type transport system involved in cytochrome c biogenesis permease subunit
MTLARLKALTSSLLLELTKRLMMMVVVVAVLQLMMLMTMMTMQQTVTHWSPVQPRNVSFADSAPE